jgi:hypothetical protein
LIDTKLLISLAILNYGIFLAQCLDKFARLHADGTVPASYKKQNLAKGEIQ